MIWLIVWTILLFYLATNVFVGWSELFWIVTWFIPPLILWPILQGAGV